MALIYNRRITVRRPRIGSAERPGRLPDVGLQDDYSGVNQGDDFNESVVARDLPANIQYVGQARAKGAELPADTQNRTNWDIYLPPKVSRLGLVKVRDVVVDELGNRYQVTAPDWGALGYRLRTELEEA